MREITVLAFAKLNLSLDVLGKRDDGYHEMKTIMQSADLYDRVHITLNDSGKFSSSSNLHFLPCDDRNIAVKAARLFFEETGDAVTGAEIKITKRIPVCAGLGGGSSDGAAVLRGLNDLTGAGLSAEKLRELAEKLGSDVPFCVEGGTALGCGRGEILTDLAPLPDCSILICKPEFSVSTPALFQRIDHGTTKCHPDTEGIIAALDAGNLKGVARRMFNVFEGVLDRKKEVVTELKNRMLDHGAIGVSMSGTGSAVFGIFDSEEKAGRASKAVNCNSFICRPLPKLQIKNV